ncbi:hypothetical protein V2J09_022535 [Rumex salicifolius]
MAKLSPAVGVLTCLVFILINVSADQRKALKEDDRSSSSSSSSSSSAADFLREAMDLLWDGLRTYTHTWPAMEFGWKIVVGSIIGFLGAAFGSVGGVGGGGIFVPMLTLIIGFDTKSSTAISKCMIMGASASAVIYNLRQRHPTLDMPLIDYDLAVLFQPMLVLGISIGVAFNVIFADWMVTVLLIILFIGTSTRAFLKGVETWKKETIQKKEAAQRLEASNLGSDEVEYKPLPGEPTKETAAAKSSNLRWKEISILVSVWVAILALQIIKLPVAFGASGYEAVLLYKGKRVLKSRGEAGSSFKVVQLILYCFVGMVAGIVGGLLGLGGGFILGPLFLEIGIPPQVSSATATFAMMFSSSMSVVEYYLLKRFPVPYALYLVAVATVAAVVGQFAVKKVIAILGRASLIIFILATTIFVSAISLGGVGIAKIIYDIENHEYMGFESLCSSDS